MDDHSIRAVERVVGDAEIASYRRDGVVRLRGAFETRWLEALAAGVRRDLANPTERLVRHTPADADAHYWEDFWAWSEIPEFEEFLRDSPAGAIAGALLRAERINVVMDNWFLREAGSRGRPPWHHDVSYFDFEGTMCVLWLPLQATTAENGIAFVRGSHLWGKLFRRVFFRDPDGRGERPVEVNGQIYHPLPDIDADPNAFDLVSFACEPGDCLVFDMRTLHGAVAEAVTTEDATRFTVRLSAEDGRIRYRGDWAKGERAIMTAAGHREGDALDSPFFPRIWERPASGPV